MRISDMITAYLLQQMNSCGDDGIEIRRNELAGEIGCVPSQINYVLNSRFTPENGFVVESRRGGGGYVRVRRVCFDSNISEITHVVDSIGDSLVESAAFSVVRNLGERNVIDPQSVRIMLSAVSDRTFKSVPVLIRDSLRADILKRMLMAAVMSD